MDEKLNFDEALKKLEDLVKQMQSGDVRISELQPKVAEALRYVEVCKSELDAIKKDIEGLQA